MEKRIDELKTRILKNKNKSAEVQAHEKKVRKACTKMIDELSEKNLELIWKLDKDKKLLENLKELKEKVKKLPKRLLRKKKRSKYIPKLESIKEDEDLGKRRRKSRKRKRKSRSS